jgi:hypothetical protein
MRRVVLRRLRRLRHTHEIERLGSVGERRFDALAAGRGLGKIEFGPSQRAMDVAAEPLALGLELENLETG